MGKRQHGLAALRDNARKLAALREAAAPRPRRWLSSPAAEDEAMEAAAAQPMKLLLIEADPAVSGAFKRLLDTAGFDVELRSSSQETPGEAALAHFPVVMIGARTRRDDRANLLRRLHERAAAAPSLLLTAPDAERQRPSPSRRHLVTEFQIEALVRRLQSLLTRRRYFRRLALRFGNVSVDPDGQVVVGRKVAYFRPAEVMLLSLLIRRQGKIVPKNAIEARLYGKTDRSTANAVEVQVHRLRKRLAAAAANVSVRTIRNAGYFIACDDATD